MKILLAFDGSEHSEAAARELAARPWPANSVVRILMAVRAYVPSAVEFVSTGETADQIQDHHVDSARELVETVAESLRATGLHVETAVKKGDPRRLIVDEAKSWGADLIVMGACGHTAFERWLIGSVAQSVVSHARCSVELVRHPQ
jgi:nucleotide-binding universal stress UspA family protein